MSRPGNIPFGPGPLRGLRVFVAEDHAITASHVEVILEEAGARLVGSCGTITAALAALRTQSVEFLILDMRLIDGYADPVAELAQALKIPYAVFTGHIALPSNAVDLAVAILSKPLQRRDLIDVLSRYAR